MIPMMRTVVTLVLVLAALQATYTSGNDALAQVPTSNTPKPRLALFSKEYNRYNPEWRRGGAWMFHDDFHPCERFGNTCTIANRDNTVEDTSNRVRMHVNTTIVAHRGFVNVSFTLPHSMQANANDTIAVYCAAGQEQLGNASPDDLDFFDYIYMNDSRTTLSTSTRSTRTRQPQQSGWIVFGPLVNQRCAYEFRYLRSANTPLTYARMGATAYVEMESGHSEPTGIHIALTTKPTELRVMWTTGRVVQPVVRYGRDRYNLIHTAHAASSRSYRHDDMCTSRARVEAAAYYRHPGYIHDALLTNVTPGASLAYTVGSATGIWSDIITLIAPPARVEDTPQSFFVFGDLGDCVLVPSVTEKPYASSIDGVSIATLRGSVMDVLTQDYDASLAFSSPKRYYTAVIHVGDLSYARGRTFLWDQFHSLVESVASRLPYMVAIGNHEYDYTSGGIHDVSGAGATNGYHPLTGNYHEDSSGECGVPTAMRFHMPEASSSLSIDLNPNNGVFWYSFDLGLVHHVVLSSEHDYTPGSRMHTWLEKDFARVDRRHTPWLLLHLHRSMYCSQAWAPDYNVSLLLRAALEPLLQQHRVDVVFSGHYHAYERTCAVMQETCRYDDADGKALAPVHIMVGSGGATLDDATYWDKPWSVNVQSEYGYGRVHVANATHLQFELVRIKGRVVSDMVWIHSTHDW